jgi:hypothetical protein
VSLVVEWQVALLTSTELETTLWRGALPLHTWLSGYILGRTLKGRPGESCGHMVTHGHKRRARSARPRTHTYTRMCNSAPYLSEQTSVKFFTKKTAFVFRKMYTRRIADFSSTSMYFVLVIASMVAHKISWNSKS